MSLPDRPRRRNISNQNVRCEECRTRSGKTVEGGSICRVFHELRFFIPLFYLPNTSTSASDSGSRLDN